MGFSNRNSEKFEKFFEFLEKKCPKRKRENRKKKTEAEKKAGQNGGQTPGKIADKTGQASRGNYTKTQKANLAIATLFLTNILYLGTASRAFSNKKKRSF